MYYRLVKFVEAPDITEAVKREKKAPVYAIEEWEPEEEDVEIGYHARRK